MHLLLKRIVLLALALAIVAGPAAESIAAGGPPVAGAAKKKKKCKKKGKKKKGKRKGRKCKRSRGGLGGLPTKPNPPKPPEDPDDPPAELKLIQSISLTENPLLGGTSGTGQVLLQKAAPSGGTTVTLGSADPSRATVPDFVHVNAGQTTASFLVDTTTGPPASVELTAATPDSVRKVTLDLVDKASLKSLSLDYQCYPSAGLTDFGTNVVSLNVRAPGNEVVDLQSSDPFTLAVPPTVTVPQTSFTGVFGVDTLAATTTPVTVTATYDGISKTDTATIRDNSSPLPVATDLTMHPPTVVVGDPSTGTVTLDCEAPAGGVTVNLATTYAGVTVPSSVTVPAGELSADFPIATVVSATPGDATIEATTGATTVQGTLTLRAIGS